MKRLHQLLILITITSFISCHVANENQTSLEKQEPLDTLNLRVGNKIS